MESRLKQNLFGKDNSYIFPFFWQSGAGRTTIETELEKVYECGLRAICVEARPHPDYGGVRWWEDMDLVMDFARSHKMKVWLLDDDRFPTGHANGAFSNGNHPLAVKFLTVRNTDVCGPVMPGYLLVRALPGKDDELLGVTASRRRAQDSPELEADSTVDISGYVKNGWLVWNVPEGLWRIQVFYTTRHGNGKLDYFNILDSASVRLLIDRIYEPHYKRYAEDFGQTFQGFFSDEPEFSNLPGYDFQARLGHNMPFIPWSGELEARLRKRWGEAFLRKLPALWLDVGADTMHIRYEYMDETTKQLAVSFSGQIGRWCAEHRVGHIGHIIEDDNSHGRLGCSTGHYFRSQSDMRMAGIDVVLLQIMPGMNQEEHQWVASSRDGEFFYYGLGKMGSSLAHIDPKKKGDSLCEIFGAFGWQEGTGLMKWLADHMLSRGINHFVPHAFSQKPYPDPDCPPHFYAHGKNPQFGLFGALMGYMNRLAHMFSGGWYPAQTAVLYHADSEWAGEAMLFQKPVRVLLENQLDCDVIPMDLLKRENSYGAFFQDGICVRENCYRTLILPGSQRIPLAAAEFILKHGGDMQILFVSRRPEGICEKIGREKEQQLLKGLALCKTVSLSELPDYVQQRTVPFVHVASSQPWLRTYPYRGGDGNWYLFCFNEGVRETVDTMLTLNFLSFSDGQANTGYEIVGYDAMHNHCMRVPYRITENGFELPVYLEAFEAVVYVVREKGKEVCPRIGREAGKDFPCGEEWRIAYQDVNEEILRPLAICRGEEEFPDLAGWCVQNRFCGTFSYKTRLRISGKQAGGYYLRLFGNIDGAEVYVNGSFADRAAGMPCRCEISLEEGENQLEIRLPVTPVWRDGDPWSGLTVLPALGLTGSPKLCRINWEGENEEA